MKKTTGAWAWLVATGAVAVAMGGASCGSSSSGTDTTGVGAGSGTGAGASVGGSGQGGNGGDPSAGGSTYTGTGGAPTETKDCLGMYYECGDLQDNDNDGLIDSQDPDCLGPCDNTEDSFYGGIPGQAGPPCLVDCYFDFDSGQGNDNCYWSHECDTHEVSPDYYPEPENGSLCAYNPNTLVPVSNGAPQSCDDLKASQSQQCMDYCGPLTPNGCDCFGCCELPAGGGNYVWLGSEGADGTSVCTMADIADPTKCHPCDPVPSCLNDCGTCELCLGKTTLPPECYGEGGGGGGTGGSGGAPQDCPDEYQPCGLPGQDPCPSGSYCTTGCCVPVPQ